MYNQIRMPLACFALLLYVMIYYMAKKRLPTARAKVFERMTYLSLVHVLASIVTEYTVNNRDKVSPLFNHIWHIVFLVSCSGMCALLYLYLIQYVERGIGQVKKTAKRNLTVVTAISILGELVLPISYIDTEFGAYSLGWKAYSLYLVVVYCLVMMVCTIIRYWKYLPMNQCVLLLCSVLAFVVVSLIQIAFPYILLTGFAATFVVMGIMFNTEDVHMYTSGNNTYYNELGCREILSEALLTGSPFQIAVYVFVGGDSSVEAGMKSIASQLDSKHCRAICGSVADNCMLVIPMHTRNAAFPLPLLPVPDCGDERASYFLEVLDFCNGETVDTILRRVRDIKNRYEENALQQDDLTGLLRRAPFIRQVEAMLDSEQEFTLLMIDLDNFKRVNDRYGHSVGDQVLREFADILRAELSSADLMCRMGGDEFGVVLVDLTNPEQIGGIVDKLQSRITAVKVLYHTGAEISLSVGARINTHADHVGSFQHIYAESDAALYQSKYRGKCRLTFSGS